MWLMLVSIRTQAHGFTMPLPLLLVWPFIYLAALLALVLPSKLHLAQRRAIASSWAVPFHLRGARIHVVSRDGVRVAIRFI